MCRAFCVCAQGALWQLATVLCETYNMIYIISEEINLIYVIYIEYKYIYI